MDNEAGLEHLSRHVCRRAEVMSLLSDPSPRGLCTAERIRELVGELGLDVGEMVLVVNEMRPRGLGGDTVGWKLPWDAEVAHMDAESRSVFTLPGGTPALLAVEELTDTYLVRDGGERSRRGR